jgi:hypothetical protein
MYQDGQQPQHNTVKAQGAGQDEHDKTQEAQGDGHGEGREGKRADPRQGYDNYHGWGHQAGAHSRFPNNQSPNNAYRLANLPWQAHAGFPQEFKTKFHDQRFYYSRERYAFPL